MTNESGITPLEYNVLIKQDIMEDTYENSSIIKGFVNEADRLRAKAKQAKATIIDMGAEACDDWKDKPKIGDRIIMQEYAGNWITGKDAEQYRLIADKDIKAIIDF